MEKPIHSHQDKDFILALLNYTNVKKRNLFKLANQSQDMKELGVRQKCCTKIKAKNNNILFTKYPWPGDNEQTFRSSNQAATCLPPTLEASH